MSQAELKPDETVYVTGSVGNRRKYHTVKDCPALQKSNVIREERYKHFAELGECSLCQNGGKPEGSRDEYDEQECDLCEQSYKVLASHIKECPEL